MTCLQQGETFEGNAYVVDVIVAKLTLFTHLSFNCHSLTTEMTAFMILGISVEYSPLGHYILSKTTVVNSVVMVANG